MFNLPIYLYRYKIWWFSSSLREITRGYPLFLDRPMTHRFEMGPMGLESLVERRLVQYSTWEHDTAVEFPWNFNQKLECYWQVSSKNNEIPWQQMMCLFPKLICQPAFNSQHCCSTRWHALSLGLWAASRILLWMPISSSLSIPQRLKKMAHFRDPVSYSTRNLSLMARWKCKVTILVCKTLETFVLYDFVCVSISRSIVSHDAHKKPWSKIGELVNHFEPYPHVNLPLRP